MDTNTLGELVRAGEGPTVEWKVQLPGVDRTGATLCAFANGAGGHLVVGLRDDGFAEGVDDADATARELEEAASRLLPPQPITVEAVQFRGALFVVCEIASAKKPPIAMWHVDGEETAYVRVGASTRKASRADLKASWNARGVDDGEDDLSDDEVDALRRIRGMKETAFRSVVSGLHKGTRAGRNLVKALQRRGYLVRGDDGRIALTAHAHRALERRRV